MPLESLDAVVSSFPEFFDRNDIDRVVDRYSLPLVVSRDDENEVVQDKDALTDMFRDLRDRCVGLGAVRSEVNLISQAVADDSAFVVTENTFLGAGGDVLLKSRVNYVLRLGDSGWQICVLAVKCEDTVVCAEPAPVG